MTNLEELRLRLVNELQRRGNYKIVDVKPNVLLAEDFYDKDDRKICIMNASTSYVNIVNANDFNDRRALSIFEYEHESDDISKIIVTDDLRSKVMYDDELNDMMLICTLHKVEIVDMHDDITHRCLTFSLRGLIDDVKTVLIRIGFDKETANEAVNLAQFNRRTIERFMGKIDDMMHASEFDKKHLMLFVNGGLFAWYNDADHKFYVSNVYDPMTKEELLEEIEKRGLSK